MPLSPSSQRSPETKPNIMAPTTIRHGHGSGFLSGSFALVIDLAQRGAAHYLTIPCVGGANRRLGKREDILGERNNRYDTAGVLPAH